MSTPVAAYLPAETWYWNGLALSQPYWNITTFGGSRSGIPVNRGTDYPVPYRAGQAFRQKYPDERTITLTMWLDGSSTAAGLASDARLAFNTNWQTIRAAFFTRNLNGSVQGQLTRNWYLTQAGATGLVTATAMAEIAGSMDLTMNGRTGAAFSTDLLLADPYFYGPPRTQTIGTGGGVITAYGEGVVGEGFPSAVSSFTVTCTAPCTVTNTSESTSFTLASGPAYPVTVDCLNYTATDSSGANVGVRLTHAGSRLWMGLVSGSNSIAVSAGTATFAWSDCYI